MPPATSHSNPSQEQSERRPQTTQPSSVDHLAVERSYTRGLPSTATYPEAPGVATYNDNQNSRTPHQNHTDPWDSAPNTVSMFPNAHRFNISGQPHFVNIANLNQLNNLGGSQGLENFRKSVSLNALHDSSAQELERQVHQVLRKNTLKQLQDWTDNPIVPERIIWLHGPASIGKTAIALDIAWTGREKVAATFFFSRTDAYRNDGNRLFPTLAWQFMVSIPDIKNHIIHSIDERPDLPNKGIEAQFEYLIAQPFAAMKEATSAVGLSDLVVIIDGIDECTDIRLQRRILKVIGNAIQDCRVPLRFIISSRPDAHIQETFRQFQCPIFYIDLARFSPAEEVRKREEEIGKREEEVRKREEEVGTREEEVRKREEEIGKREEEIRRREEEIENPTGPPIPTNIPTPTLVSEDVGTHDSILPQIATPERQSECNLSRSAFKNQESAQASNRLRVRFHSDVSPMPTRPPSRQQDRPDYDYGMDDSQPSTGSASRLPSPPGNYSREGSPRIDVPRIIQWLHHIEQESPSSSPPESFEPPVIPTSVLRPQYWPDNTEPPQVIHMAPANSYQQPVLHPVVIIPVDNYQQSVPYPKSRWTGKRR